MSSIQLMWLSGFRGERMAEYDSNTNIFGKVLNNT